MMEKLSDKIQMEKFSIIEENLKEIREKIANAAVRSGRKYEDITMLAATKTVDAVYINHAIKCNVTHIGENKVQELMDKYESLDLTNTECHFIGRLQTNKVKYLVGKVNMIESVDNSKLLRTIDSFSQKKDIVTDILIEVNIGREANKSGVIPEMLDELFCEAVSLDNVCVRGLMAIPPASDNMSELSKYFSAMYKYYIDIQSKKLDNKSNKVNILSMGMSSDYETAILCGSNFLRIGSSIFGKRNYNL